MKEKIFKNYLLISQHLHWTFTVYPPCEQCYQPDRANRWLDLQARTTLLTDISADNWGCWRQLGLSYTQAALPLDRMQAADRLSIFARPSGR